MLSPWTVTLSLVAIIIATIYRYISHKQRFFERTSIPHLKPTFLIGNQGGMVFQQRSFIDQIKWLYKQLPEAKYHGFYDFITPVIMIKDPSIIQEITVKNFDSFTDHSSFTIDELDPLFSRNLFALRGQKWREFRATLSPSFTATRLKGMFNLINQCALDFKEYLLNENKESQAIDTKDLFARYTNDVIASAAFGMTVNSLKERDNEFYLFGRRVTTFDYLRTMKLFVMRSFPFIAKLFRVRNLSPTVTDFFVNIVESNVKVRKSQGISRPDMIQLMIQANEESKTGFKMDLMDMTSQVFTFFFAGFETTSTTMCFVAHQLAANPEVQKKLTKEIKKRYSAINNETTGYDALRDFPYLDAVVNETLRMYPPAQQVDRVCTKRFELPAATPGGKPVTVEPGTVLWLPIAGIHYDPQYHDEPEKFKPERYLDSEGIEDMEVDLNKY